jgi:hypothetical protein
MSTYTMKKGSGNGTKKGIYYKITSETQSRVNDVPVVFLDIFSYHSIRAEL